MWMTVKNILSSLIVFFQRKICQQSCWWMISQLNVGQFFKGWQRLLVLCSRKMVPCQMMKFLDPSKLRFNTYVINTAFYSPLQVKRNFTSGHWVLGPQGLIMVMSCDMAMIQIGRFFQPHPNTTNHIKISAKLSKFISEMGNFVKRRKHSTKNKYCINNIDLLFICYRIFLIIFFCNLFLTC